MITQSKYFISDFIDIQRNSFQNLLKQGLIDEFLLRNPISDSSFEVFFYPEYYKLSPPEWNIREAILKGKTYSSKLYMPVQFTDKKNKKILLKWVLLGEIPIMTNRGYFIFNGAPRVVVNQLIRSPGLYYQEKKINLYATQKDEKPFATLKRFYADFICLRGTWLRIEIDKERNIWAQFKKARKIPLLWFLHAMGLSQAMIFKYVSFPQRLLANFEKNETTSDKKLSFNIDNKKDLKAIKTPPEAWRKIVELLKLQRDPPLRTKNISEKDINKEINSVYITNNDIPTDGFLDSPMTEKNKQSINASQIFGNSFKLSVSRTMLQTGLALTNQNVLVFCCLKQNRIGEIKNFYMPNSHILKKNLFPIISLENLKPFPEKKNFFRKKEKQKRIPLRDLTGDHIIDKNLNLNANIQKPNVDKKLALNSFSTEFNSVSVSERENVRLSSLVSNDTLQKGKLALSNVSLQRGFSFMNIDHQSEIEAEELGRKWMYNKFMNSRNYDLGKQGRDSFNRKLGLNISPLHTTLTPQDVLYATDYLLKVEKGLKNVDDIDHLMNRKIRTSGELIQMQIGLSIVRLEKTIREKFKSHLTQLDNNLLFQYENKEIQDSPLGFSPERTGNNKMIEIQENSDLNLSAKQLETSSDTRKNLIENKQISKTIKRLTSGEFIFDQLINKTQLKITKSNEQQTNDLERLVNSLINSKIFNGTLREFFGTNPLSQFMDQMNPLAEITHKRRLSSMGPGGVGRENAPMAIRSIHPTHYGRICPIETPEGKNTGLVNSLTTCAQVTFNGFIETPFYKVYKGQVQKNLGIFYLNTEQEEKLKSAPADVTVSNVGFLPKSNIPLRIATEFTKIERNKVQFIAVSPIQMISVATSLIPFLEHDDANRALMGSNMQRQAVPIIKAQRPIVGTGLEARTASDSGHVLQTKKSGFVTYVSSEKIIIYSILE
jgi:DNA-directed RNA polymerase beta subunit